MAISMRLNTRRRTAVATARRLPRYARNDKVGTDEMLGVLACPPYPSLRGAQRYSVIARSARSSRARRGTWQSRCGWTHVGEPPLLRRRDCHATLAMTRWVRMRCWACSRAHLIRHCEERSVILSLRGAPAHPEPVEGRGNLDVVGHTSANRCCYGEEIATLRSQ